MNWNEAYAGTNSDTWQMHSPYQLPRYSRGLVRNGHFTSPHSPVAAAPIDSVESMQGLQPRRGLVDSRVPSKNFTFARGSMEQQPHQMSSFASSRSSGNFPSIHPRIGGVYSSYSHAPQVQAGRRWISPHPSNMTLDTASAVAGARAGYRRPSVFTISNNARPSGIRNYSHVPPGPTHPVGSQFVCQTARYSHSVEANPGMPVTSSAEAVDPASAAYIPCPPCAPESPLQHGVANGPKSWLSVDFSLEHSPPIPLRNMGNTCYLNSVMQCLLNCSGLASSLAKELGCAYSLSPCASELKHPPQQIFQLAPVTTAFLELAEQRSSCASLADRVFTQHAGNTGQAILAIKAEAAKRNDEFAGYGQADAHEFLRIFLIAIHDELNRSSVLLDNASSNSSERQRQRAAYHELEDVADETESMAYERWKAHLLRSDDSVVYDYFGGMERTLSTCDTCNKASFNFSPLLDLSVPLEPPGKSSRWGHSKSTATLDTILAQSFSDVKEAMRGRNQLLCGKCKKLRNGARSVVIKEWPSMLVVHLKRFDMYGKKNSAPVVYPKSFMPGHHQQQRYTLSGVVCHTGTEMYGHYTSFVCVRNAGSSAPAASEDINGTSVVGGRSDGSGFVGRKRSEIYAASAAYSDRSGSEGLQASSETWYLCNDASISAVSEAEVMKALTHAYILFYSCD